MLLEKISNFLVKNKNRKIFFYVFFVFIFFMLSNNVTFAGETDRTKILSSILAGISAIAGLGVYFVTMFLDPEFTSGKLFHINDKLHDIWILVSNVVYFIFAFILIWIAFMNIIGKGDKWELKQALPKFIVGVLIVPFSWFIVNVVVSIANILAMAALALPADVFKGTTILENIQKTDIEINCKLDFSKLSEPSGTSNASSDTTTSWFDCDGDKKVKISDITDSSFWLLSSYVYGLIKPQKLSNIKVNQLSKTIKNVVDLILYIVFNLIFILIFTILLITLLIVLLVRIVWLWIYLALSPLFGLAYFFGKDAGGDILKKFSFSNFIGLAMVPTYVLLALGFGFMFLSITLDGLSKKSGSTTENSKYVIASDNNGNSTITIKNIGKNENAILTIVGAPLFLDTSNESDGGIFGNIANISLGFVGAVFINVFGVVIFWISIMAALRSSEITKAVTEPMYNFGKSIGDLAMKAPTYAPIFPGGKSMTELSQAARSFSGTIESYYSGKGSKSGTKFAEDLGFTATDARKALNEFNAKFNSINAENIKRLLVPLLKQLGTDNISKSDFDNIILSLVKKGILDESKAKNLKFNDRKNPETFGKELFNSITQKVKDNSGGLLDGSNDLIDLYKLGHMTDTSTFEDKMSKVSKNYTRLQYKNGEKVAGTGIGKINIGGTTINVNVNDKGYVSGILDSDKDDFAEQVISLVSDHRKLSSLLGKINMEKDKYWKAIESYVYQKNGDIKFFRNSEEAKVEGYKSIENMEEYEKLLSSKKISKDSKKTGK